MIQKGKTFIGNDPGHSRSLLLWPGILIVVLQWLVRFGLPVISPEASAVGILVGLAGGLAVIVWWVFFSRASKSERWGALFIIVGVMVFTSRIVDESIRTGMQGLMFYVYCIPILSLAFVTWAVVSSRFADRLRCLLMIAVIFISCGVWTLLRCDGITGNAGAYFSWRWSETSEDRLLSQAGNKLNSRRSAETATPDTAEWPGFRGPMRDGIVRGVQIETDWKVSPPEELWRRPVGPGCSSFAVQGNLFYTQEQRGEEELVSCYNLSTGVPVWRHADQARFWDSHAGAGPRSTPTLSKGRVYTIGATGILNVLDAADGSVLWSRDASSDTQVELPEWGFTSSPLVYDKIVLVAFTGSLVAYDIDTGNPLWFGSDGGSGYSSPHLLTIEGIEQVLLMSEIGASSFEPGNGKLLWKHQWEEGDRIVQPALIEGGSDLLIAGFKGTRRIAVEHGPGEWTAEEKWTTTKLKPFFNDFVIHKGNAFGFFGPSLTCINIENGQRSWKSGRYGGQFVLLADQDLLIVLTEKGDLALVEAVPDQFRELAKIPAIEGKTWNHPVIVGNVLLVRNAQEMVAFQLTLATG